jgi:hypothetical protein
MDSTGFETDGVDNSTSNMSIGTTVGDNPWNIFTSNVAALYYFCAHAGPSAGASRGSSAAGAACAAPRFL